MVHGLKFGFARMGNVTNVRPRHFDNCLTIVTAMPGTRPKAQREQLFRVWRQGKGWGCVDELGFLMRGTTYKRTSRCYRCNEQCPLYVVDSATETNEEMITAIPVGSTCVDFAMMGSGHELL